jgi:Subtilase family
MALLAAGLAASTLGMATLPAGAGTLRSSEWWMSSLSIRNAWPVSRGAGITIAVLSDGVDTQHPDLTGPRIITGPDFTGTSQSSGQYFGPVGTGIAGIIAAHGYGVQGQNGIIGAVPLATVLSVRVTLPPGDPMLSQPSVAAQLPGAIAQGIRYAVRHGASVIDLPLDPGQAGISGSGGTTAGTAAAAGGSATEAAAVKYALSRNVVLVAPAGDDNLASDAPNYPAAYPGVIAVGAFNKDFVKAPWTSHQSYVTVTAAGEGMTVATNTGSFQTASSTAYASAVVAGIVAMLQSRFPGITVAQVRHALIKGTVFHGAGGHTNGSGYGTVNADKALLAAATQLTPPAGQAGAHVTQATAAAAPAAAALGHPGLAHSVIRSAIAGGAVLVVLLLLIAIYALRGRRRAARQRAAQPAGWSRDGARHPRAGAAVTDADRMAAFFAAPVTAPARAPSAPVAERPVSRGLRPSAAERVFSGASRPAPLGDGQRAGRPPAAPYAPWDVADAGSRSPVGPASRAVAKRPAVSGAPPWEEAQPPEGDLPWASPADRGLAAGRPSGPRPARAAAPAPAASPAPPLPTRTSALQPESDRRSQLPPPRHASTAEPIQAFEPAESSGPVEPFEPAATFEPTAAFQPAATFEPTGAFQPGKAFQAVAAHADFRRMAQRQHTGRQQADRPADPFGPEQFPAEPARSAAGADFGQPGGPGQPAGFGQPSGGFAALPDDTAASGPRQNATGRLDWARQQPAEDAPATPEGPARELQVPGGTLPVRQPRRPTPPAALSPSGSLWERNVEPVADTPADSADPASRPIFVWNPAAGADSFPADSGELTPKAPDWSLRGRHGRPAGD